MSPIHWSLRTSLPAILLLLGVCGLAASGAGLAVIWQAQDISALGLPAAWLGYILWALVGLMVVLTLCGLRIVFGGLLQPLQLAQSRSELICKGDLTFQLEPSVANEMGRLLLTIKKMQEHMSRSISGVQQSLATIGSGAQHIVAGNTDLSSRTDQQAAALQQAAASMEELAGTVKQNADNARQANQLAVTASEVAQRGGQAVGEVVSTMHGISASSHKIADIVGVIDSIAFQTNILALNAAVEAARAGEQGKGFAVVASEVRALAQRSAQAAREIKDLIEDSVRKVSEGSDQVERAGDTMEEIVTSVARVTDIMGEISAATVEQSSGIDQINIVVAQIDSVTRQNAQLVEDANVIGATLRQDVTQISTTMGRFKLPPNAVIDVTARAVAPSSGMPVPDARHAARQASAAGSSAAAPAARSTRPPKPAAPALKRPIEAEVDRQAAAGGRAALPPSRPAKRDSDEDDWEEF